MRGITYYKLHQLSESMRDINQALSINNSLAEAYFYRAQIFLELGDNGFARADLKQYLQLNPNSPNRTIAEKRLQELSK